MKRYINDETYPDRRRDGIKYICMFGALLLAYLTVYYSLAVGHFVLMQGAVKFEQGAGPNAIADREMVLVTGPVNIGGQTLSVGDATFKNVILVRATTERRRGSGRRYGRLISLVWTKPASTYAASDSAMIGNWHVRPEVLKKMQGDGQIARPGIDFQVPAGWHADGDSIHDNGFYTSWRRTYSIWRPGQVYTVIARKSGESDLALFDTYLPLDDDYTFVQSGALTSLSVLEEGNLRGRIFAFMSLLGFFLAAWTALALFREPPEEPEVDAKVPLAPLLWAMGLSGALALFCVYLTEGPVIGYGAFIIVSLPVAALFFLRGRKRRRDENRSEPRSKTSSPI